MLLRSTQGGCRYATTHPSSSIRVYTTHRASRRTQEAAHVFERGTAVHSSREGTITQHPGFALRAKLEKFMYVRGLLPVAVSRYEHPRVLLVLLVLLYL